MQRARESKEKLTPLVSQADQEAALSKLESDLKARLDRISKGECPFDDPAHPLVIQLLGDQYKDKKDRSSEDKNKDEKKLISSARITSQHLKKIYEIALNQINVIKSSKKNKDLYTPGLACIRVPRFFKGDKRKKNDIPPRTFALVARWKEGKWTWNVVLGLNKKMADGTKNDDFIGIEGSFKKVKRAYGVDTAIPTLRSATVNKEHSYAETESILKEVEITQELLREGIPVFDKTCSPLYVKPGDKYKREIYSDYAGFEVKGFEPWVDLHDAWIAIETAKDMRIKPIFFADGLYLMWQVLNSVFQLHKHRKLHRDLKKSNFLLDSQFKLYINDFDTLVKLKPEDSERVKVEKIKGTLYEMSPEKLVRLAKSNDCTLEGYFQRHPHYNQVAPSQQIAEIQSLRALHVKFDVKPGEKLADNKGYQDYAAKYSEKYATFKEDIFSVGTILYDLFSGIKNLTADHSFDDSIRRIDILIQKLTSFDEDERPSLDEALTEFMSIIPSLNLTNEHFKLTPEAERQRFILPLAATALASDSEHKKIEENKINESKHSSQQEPEKSELKTDTQHPQSNNSFFNELKENCKATSSSSKQWIDFYYFLKKANSSSTDESINNKIHSLLSPSSSLTADELFELQKMVHSDARLKEKVSQHLFLKILCDTRFWLVHSFASSQIPKHIRDMQQTYRAETKKAVNIEKDPEKKEEGVFKEKEFLLALKNTLPKNNNQCTFFSSPPCRSEYTQIFYDAIRGEDKNETESKHSNKPERNNTTYSKILDSLVKKPKNALAIISRDSFKDHYCDFNKPILSEKSRNYVGQFGWG